MSTWPEYTAKLPGTYIEGCYEILAFWQQARD